MKLFIFLAILRAAWTLDGWADALVIWAEQKCSDEVFGIGRVE